LDTKSRSTNLFKGILSWISLVALLLIVTSVVILMVAVIFDSDLSTDMSIFFTSFSNLKAIPLEHQIQFISGLALFLSALILVFSFRKDRKCFEKSIAKIFSKTWAEVKILLICGTFTFFTNVMMLDVISLILISVILIYLICLDIGYNRHFFNHNIIRSILNSMNSYKTNTPFEKKAIRRLYSSVLIIVAILISSTFFMYILSNNYYYLYLEQILFVVVSFIIISIVGVCMWYLVAYKQELKDISILMSQIEEMYAGNLQAENHVPIKSNLYNSAMQLNMIRTGIQKAVEDGIKADMIKVELITNVSHDIKTPLTSIISYVELLKKDKNLPDYAKEYINTISAKADRLNSIVQDVFEVSKAATGNMSLNLENINIGKLLQQTFAEMDENINASSITWRIEISEEPILVNADGQRMYRVFQNLIRNCLQYALEGSRAYVQLSSANDIVSVSIRNVSRDELSVDSEHLLARFSRGDKTRTTEGSGLGLSIAKSFTEACGGTFTIYTDSDIFTVIVAFPIAKAELQVIVPTETVEAKTDKSETDISEAEIFELYVEKIDEIIENKL